MEIRKNYSIPTEEQMRNIRNRQIIESNNEELLKLYDEVIQGIWHYGHIQVLAADFKKDKGLIICEFRKRGLRKPGLLYKMKTVWASI